MNANCKVHARGAWMRSPKIVNRFTHNNLKGNHDLFNKSTRQHFSTKTKTSNKLPAHKVPKQIQFYKQSET